MLIMYSPHPSHGTPYTSIPCPDSEADLKASVFESGILADLDKVRWYDHTGWENEGHQFNAGWEYTDVDVIVKLDADECWAPGLLEAVVAHAVEQNCYETRVLLRHYWRSFHRAFTHDPAAPGRVYIRHLPKQETTYHSADNAMRIHHYGYAERVSVVRYKMSIHGHRGEFTNPNWFEEVYAANRQTDCHPIGMDSWAHPNPVTPPDFMLDHPYAQLTLIE
jgi:glycosyltransferase involved in cell wall biosynthesis